MKTATETVRVRTGYWADWTPRLPITYLQKWAFDADESGIWTPHRAQCMPLIEFPDSHLARIRYEVDQGWKPAYWLDLGLAQIPSRSWWEWHWQRGVDPDARRPAIPKRVRQLVLERDGLICQLCGGKVEPSDVHLDHVKPWSKGGQHTMANLQVTHSLCNMRKAAKFNEATD